MISLGGETHTYVTISFFPPVKVKEAYRLAYFYGNSLHTANVVVYIKKYWPTEVSYFITDIGRECNNMEVPLCPMLPDFRKSIALWKVPRPRPFILLENSSILMKISKENRLNDIDRVKPKYFEETLSQCHFVHHKSLLDWSGIEPWPSR